MSDRKPSPIEVWLRQTNLEVTCSVVEEDESTYELEVNSLSVRGAMREMTGSLLSEGYKPVGRWDVTAEDGEGGAAEAVRKFKI